MLFPSLKTFTKKQRENLNFPLCQFELFANLYNFTAVILTASSAKSVRTLVSAASALY
jgi:hypothetical protein